jgi:addiction module HigA family antidote
MARMHNPPHPGEVIWDTVLRTHSGITVTEFAKRLGVSALALSRVLSGEVGISAEMAGRLAATLRGSPDSWMHLQLAHNLWHALKKRRQTIIPLDANFAMN